MLLILLEFMYNNFLLMADDYLSIIIHEKKFENTSDRWITSHWNLIGHELNLNGLIKLVILKWRLVKKFGKTCKVSRRNELKKSKSV